MAGLLALFLLLAPPPVVTGPRDTTSERPVYLFRARGAIGFRCAFDTTLLHRCAARYSEGLEPGSHVLRVRAVGRGGTLSKVATVRVIVRLPVPPLRSEPEIAVGAGAGVPAPGEVAVWVPVTGDGSLARVDVAARRVTARIAVGTPSGAGDLDSAVVADGSVWSASDGGGTIARVDAASGSARSKLSVAERPGGLAVGAGSVWAFHFLSSAVTRIDAATGATTVLSVNGSSGGGIAYGEGSLWLLSLQPTRVLRLNPATGSVLSTIPLEPPFPHVRSLVAAWWLAYGDGAVWTTLPENGGVARIDAATGAVRYFPVRYGNPFGVAVGDGSAWVATDRAVLRLNGATGAIEAATLVPRATRSGFVSIAFAAGAAWFTNYDRGTLVRVSAQ